MRFKVLSHACLYVKTSRSSILIDPWLLGTCYWKSWSNYPEAEFDANEVGAVDAVVISHVHWDHWHGLTLKRLLKGKKVIIPDEPGKRSERDLRGIGFHDVTRLPHGEAYMVGDIRLTLYQFGLYLNDAAIVIEAEGVTLLNVNDAKIAGWSLRHLLRRHPRIDFAFRSHSSANPRVCFKMDGGDAFVADDREHYFRSFIAFMNVVEPRFAVPFASNHCHLHEDVFGLNAYISNPLQLREYFDREVGVADWKLQIMLPGSQWDSGSQFHLRDETCFSNLPEKLSLYRSRLQEEFDVYRLKESRVDVNEKHLRKFLEMLEQGGLFGRRIGDFLITIRWPGGREASWRFVARDRIFESVPPARASQVGVPLLIFPAIIFRDAVVMNMFHHAGISKRCEFRASNPSDMVRLKRMLDVLELVELGRYPTSASYLYRLVRAYVRRWREVFVYAHALWLLRVRRVPIYLAEEAILRGEY